MKHMVANFSKLEKFKGVDQNMAKEYALSFVNHDCGVCSDYTNSRRWEIANVEHIKKRSKWENDDYVCRGIILNFIGCLVVAAIVLLKNPNVVDATGCLAVTASVFPKNPNVVEVAFVGMFELQLLWLRRRFFDQHVKSSV
ncbi:hypothetical protein Tco_0763956 [Tanacetum coccineum]